MIKVLISEDDIYYATLLMNSINEINNNVRVIGIAQNGLETIQKIADNEIDIILLDLIMPKLDGYQVLEKIKDNKKYENSCIIISGDFSEVWKLKNNSLVYRVLPKNIGINNIVKNINELIIYKEQANYENKVNYKIRKELIILGYDFSYKGTIYLFEAIKYVMFNPDKELENLEWAIYPIISKKYTTSVHNIKCSINRATTQMYCQCEVDRLKKYFHFYIDKKPNIKTIINTIINKIEMKGG